MGVPAFFRWLTNRYPRIVIDAFDPQAVSQSNSRSHSAPREESIEQEESEKLVFDNLYLDMNGIIHPCCHPEEGAAPQSEVEMFNNIFAYIDKLMRIVKPKKILYMAIDGVAPRAKMNQQRSRRFRAAIDAKIRAEKEEELRKDWEAKGQFLPGALKVASNCNLLFLLF